MGCRFRRRLSIIPGLWLNLSKSGVSLSAGGRGFTKNISSKGHQETISAPGTGGQPGVRSGRARVISPAMRHRQKRPWWSWLV